jgi:ketosteroid isomerase-like protein
MKRLICALALVALTACTPAPAPTVDTAAADLKAVVDLQKMAEKAWSAKDLDGIMAHYAPGATLVVSGAPVAKGTEAIRGMLTELFKDPALALELETINTEISGGIAYQRRLAR